MNINFLNKIFSRQVNFACKTQFFLGPVEIKTLPIYPPLILDVTPHTRCHPYKHRDQEIII